MNSVIQIAIVGVAAAVAYGVTLLTPVVPVAVNTEILSIDKFDDRVEVSLRWENQRDCEFSTLSTMQGSTQYPEDLRTPVERELGTPKGPRGKGLQQTTNPWVFYRPETIHAPEFIMTAWHRCGEEAVPSVILVVDIREWFPEG